MLHIELPYVTRLGVYLEGFVQRDRYVWNARCPVCGDHSSSSKTKRRLYIYRPGTAAHLNVKCHKCGYSTSFGNFLKLQNPTLYKEFVLDQYQSTSMPHIAHKNLNEVIPTTFSDRHKALLDKLVTDSVLDTLECCSTLPDTHQVIQVLLERQIPRSVWHLLYYTPTFVEYTNSLIPGKMNGISEHPRLVIPFFNQHGKVFAYQGRALNGEQPKYYTIKLDDVERIYGLERVDASKRIYAVEGPIDSLLLPNSIAVTGSNFDSEFMRSIKSNVVLIPDNEPRSPQIVKLILKHIKLGYSVCMLPHFVTTKDINDHLKSGMTVDYLLQLIDANTYTGAAAMLQYATWRQVK